MENCILYDWLTVSFQNVDKDTLIHLLGMDTQPWQEQENGSRLRYGHRISFDGISVHYTDDHDLKHNQGICLEMSGQGCRDFETFGKKDWWLLFEFIRLTKGKVTRLDIAYDDFHGLIPIDIMAAMARRYQYTARSQKMRIIEESEDADTNHLGISICHGSKSSNIYIRCYDKRVERHRWDIPHWVRLEVQLRNDDCLGFIAAPGDLGDKLRGVLANYLQYRCPGRDKIKARWPVAPWWSKLLQGVAAIKIHTPRDTEYNADRLDKHIYTRNHNSIKTEILKDGLSAFLGEVFGHTEPLPPKYRSILQASKNADDILRILNDTPAAQIGDCAKNLNEYCDMLGINPDQFGTQRCG